MEDAAGLFLRVLSPSFKQLETNTIARTSFDTLTNHEQSKNWIMDIEFVSYAVQKNYSSDLQSLINKAKPPELNRALKHLALMVDTASGDMKRRIFEMSSRILEQIRSDRSVVENDKKMADATVDVRPLVPSDATGQYATVAVPSEAAGQDARKDTTELDTQPLVILFEAAVKMLPEMREALQFIKVLSKIDPLIATIPVISDYDWKATVATVSDLLRKLGTQEDAIVTLTKCSHVSSSSNLLNHEGDVRILPFHSQHDLLESVICGDVSEQRPGQKWLEKLIGVFTSVGFEISMKALMRGTSPVEKESSEWKAIECQKQLRNDKIERADSPIEIYCSPRDFLAMGNE
jgi:hypothetical protein